jgi:hypothetical protein
MERTLNQSVEVFEEERRFSLRGVAEGDDPDFIFSEESSKAHQALLPISETAVFNGARGSSKDLWGVGKIEAMLPEIGSPLRLIPGIAHPQIVYTRAL